MTPTCLFCGTLDAITTECPTCGGNVYDVELADDRALVETYHAWQRDSPQGLTAAALYVPFLGGIIVGVQMYLKGRRLKRELRRRFTNKPVSPTDHAPYR